MLQTLHFSVDIHSPRARVWDTLIDPEGYRQWTAPFAEGSTFSGSWDAGARILFLSPSGQGMLSEIAENRLHEFISIRHIGQIDNGVEDTSSPAVQAWAPAFENYAFSDIDTGTRIRVDVDIPDEYAAYMNEKFPLALAALKALCEGNA